MIRIYPALSGNEKNAADKVAEFAAIAMSDLQSSNDLLLEIFPSLQCYGQKVQDLDLVVFFADYRSSRSVLSTNGCLIKSFCLTIEVKAHSSSDVSFEGSACTVLYNGKSHLVSGQSEKQKYALKKYIENNIYKGGHAPWIFNLIWLINVPGGVLPKSENNIIGSDVDWGILIDKISLLSGRKVVESFTYRSYFESVVNIFSNKIIPSKIDRKRMEGITRNVLDWENQKYAKKIGKQLLVFRGRGGTGKTVRLIRMAYQLYDQVGSRSILLTYNKALVADLSRLLTLLGVKSTIGGKSIMIKTIHKFMYEWLLQLGVYDVANNDFILNYENYKKEALDLIRSDVITSLDIQKSKEILSRDLSWENIFVDESQDWPADERDLIYEIYGYNNVIIADGVDQLVRGVDLTDWRSLIVGSNSQTVSLKKSLRLKSSLCNVISGLADIIDYQGWDLIPEENSYGGRIIIVEGDVLTNHFCNSLIEYAVNDGNEPVDVLFCVPPNWVSCKNDKSSSLVAEWCEQNGHGVWDGVDNEERFDYPTSLKQFRVVQYDSCRGLEGWVVVACGLDDFFEYKQKNAKFSTEQRSDMFFDHEAASLDFAKKWLMIPMTRAIDTLVLNISNKSSYLGNKLLELHQKFPEQVEWVVAHK